MVESLRLVQGESADSQGLPRGFGQYLLFDRIGRGGMAEIFLARSRTELGGGRRMVIKEVLPELSQDESFARMLVREAKLAARLSHRNIVHVVDLGRESGRLFIAMEYIEGYDLNQLLRQLSRRRLPLPLQFAIFVVREVLSALDYAHRASDEHGTPLGIVHRDLSPSNVLVSFEGEVHLCDFGIARAMDMDVRRKPSETAGSDPEESRIQRIRVAGKSAYMAPEHARGEQVDSRSDLFAAGILLWELCAGRRMYRGTDSEMLELARKGLTPPLPDRDLPDQPRLSAIVERALTIDPASRYQAASQMLEDLDHYALATGLMASQLRFGAFLTDHFAEEIVALRRARERAAEQAQHMADVPVADVEPVTAPSERPPSVPQPRREPSLTRRRSDPEPDELQAQLQARPWLIPVTVAVVAALIAGFLLIR